MNMHKNMYTNQSNNNTSNNNNLHFTNFKLFMNSIVLQNNSSNNKTNKDFIEGETNVIEYLISKYSNVDIKDINTIKKLCLKINKDFGLLNQFGLYLPNLVDLDLSSSRLDMSDFGPSLSQIQILNISNCSIFSLEYLTVFNNLNNLDASYNSISDLIDLEYITTLKSLNLSNNVIEDVDNLLFISQNTELEYLDMRNNSINNNKKSNEYSKSIKEMFKKMKYLDEDFNIDKINSKENPKNTNDLNNNLNSNKNFIPNNTGVTFLRMYKSKDDFLFINKKSINKNVIIQKNNNNSCSQSSIYSKSLNKLKNTYEMGTNNNFNTLNNLNNKIDEEEEKIIQMNMKQKNFLKMKLS